MTSASDVTCIGICKSYETANTVSDENGIKSKRQYHISDIIIKKRDGQTLTQDEIEFFVEGIVDNSIQKAQLGKCTFNI